MPANQLLPEESLGPDESVSSLSGRYTLVLQGDGNLVLYKNFKDGGRRPLWASGTEGKPAQICAMQDDGNLVLYGPERRANLVNRHAREPRKPPGGPGRRQPGPLPAERRADLGVRHGPSGEYNSRLCHCGYNSPCRRGTSVHWLV